MTIDLSTADLDRGNISPAPIRATQIPPNRPAIRPSLLKAWVDLVTDFTVSYGPLHVSGDTIETPPVIGSDGSWLALNGESNAGGFTVYLPTAFAREILKAVDDGMELTSMNGADAAIVFEEMLTYRLDALEEVLGASLSIASVDLVDKAPSDPILGFTLEMRGEKTTGGLSITGQLDEWAEVVFEQYAIDGEKNLDPVMQVHLGPVVLPAKQAYLAKPGQKFDCGVEPSDTIHGILLRADGRYWPIHVEDDAINIVGDLREKEDFKRSIGEPVYVTFCLGEVSLDAYSRSRLQAGDRLEMDRLPDNQAKVHYQLRYFGEGQLTILNDNLAVEIERLGGTG